MCRVKNPTLKLNFSRQYVKRFKNFQKLFTILFKKVNYKIQKSGLGHMKNQIIIVKINTFQDFYIRIINQTNSREVPKIREYKERFITVGRFLSDNCGYSTDDIVKIKMKLMLFNCDC